MEEEEASDLAFAILTDFEEVLDEYDVTISSADREGRPEEARLYGPEYHDLEDAITEILRKQGTRRISLSDARRLSFLILEEIEETLRAGGVSLPPGIAVGPYGYPCIGEKEWDRIRDMIIGVLTGRARHSRAGQREPSGPDDEAWAACEQIRRKMVEVASLLREGR